MTHENDLSRRNFLRGATVGALGAAFLMDNVAANAQAEKATPAAADQLTGAPVNIAVIGLGPRGREILAALAKVGPVAQVTTLCDKFSTPIFNKRAAAVTPKAKLVTDHKAVLADKTIQAVFIATPTHQHKQIALDAIAAGKHVYCEAPLAHTVEEARAIATAAKAAKTLFQPGLQGRCNLQALHVEHFVRSQALGKIVEARAQWHNKTSWKFVYPTKERENELNWRLSKENCAGLLGEVGIHQIDTTSWYLRERPVAVTGYSANMLYDDGRTTPDTVQCIVEYPGKVRMLYDATLTNSFDAGYETFIGTDAAVMLRDQRAWMFKEADAGQLGWEVFARKDDMIIGDVAAGSGVKLGTGIALVADATKQLALGKQPGTVGTDVTKTSLYQPIEGFLKSCQKGERVPAKEPTKTDAKPPLVPGAEEGYEATVVAIKANEAALTGSRVAFQPEWFTL
ncbi:MAG: Gfo/Idh/MocA family oxidoreductase [Actinomycetota bacterium]